MIEFPEALVSHSYLSIDSRQGPYTRYSQGPATAPLRVTSAANIHKAEHPIHILPRLHMLRDAHDNIICKVMEPLESQSHPHPCVNHENAPPIVEGTLVVSLSLFLVLNLGFHQNADLWTASCREKSVVESRIGTRTPCKIG